MKGLLAWPILMVVLTFLWIFACTQGCVYGWLAEPVIEGTQDTCTTFVQIDTPSVKCITVADYITDWSEEVRIGWRGDTTTWIDNFLVVDSSHVKILNDLVKGQMTFDSMVFIDKTSVISGVMKLDFTMCFVNPSGNFHFQTGDDIVFEWVAIPLSKRLIVRVDNFGSIYPPDESTQTELVDFTGYLRQWQKIGFFGVELDSTSMEPVYDAILGTDCKCCGILDLRGHNVSSERLQEFADRGILVMN